MSETIGLEPQISRDRVVDGFKKFVARGITNPDDLPTDDQEVVSANTLLQVWANQRGATMQRIGTVKANLEFKFERSTIYVDAGFSDPRYLDEVANDWLAQDLQEAQDKGLIEIAARIQAKINEINAKLA